MRIRLRRAGVGVWLKVLPKKVVLSAPLILNLTLEFGAPADDGKRSVRVAVAPGAILLKYVTLERVAAPSVAPVMRTLLAMLVPVLVTVTATR